MTLYERSMLVGMAAIIRLLGWIVFRVALGPSERELTRATAERLESIGRGE